MRDCQYRIKIWPLHSVQKNVALPALQDVKICLPLFCFKLCLMKLAVKEMDK